MRLATSIKQLARLSKIRYQFCKKVGDEKAKQQLQQNKFIKFFKDGWRQTFPKEEDEVRKKYKKVKQTKRYTQEELKAMQDKIPEYQRTAMVETQQKTQETKQRFKISSLIPESIKKKVTETNSYKQYSQFKQNLKQYVQTTDSATVNLGTKAYNVISQPSTAAKAAEHMKQYDKQFSLMDLQKQSTFIFRDAYHQYLQNNSEALQMLCGEQALDMFKSLLKINAVKQVRPKYTELLHYYPARLKKTLMAQSGLPSFVFQISFMQIYCMIDAQGKIVDGDDDRVMSSTFYFTIKYSGQYIGELGHPWQITEFMKVDQVKMLV